MAIDPVAAAADALVAHLLAEVDISGLQVRRGWPEHAQDFDLSGGPIITVTPGEDQGQRIAPFEVGRVTTGGSVEVSYKVASVEAVLQVDLWAAYRAQLDDAIVAVDEQLQNQLPLSSGLWLSSTGYHDRPLAFALDGGWRRQGGQDGVERGEWRATLMLRVSSDRVATRTFSALGTLSTEATIGGIVETLSSS